MTHADGARHLEKNLDELNPGKSQFPVGLNTLVLLRKSNLPPPDHTPYVYLKCAHVEGHHLWDKERVEDRTCPICHKVGDRFSTVFGYGTSPLD